MRQKANEGPTAERTVKRVLERMIANFCQGETGGELSREGEGTQEKGVLWRGVAKGCDERVLVVSRGRAVSMVVDFGKNILVGSPTLFCLRENSLLEDRVLFWYSIVPRQAQWEVEGK
jgi:hypothetical protein